LNQSSRATEFGQFLFQQLRCGGVSSAEANATANEWRRAIADGTLEWLETIVIPDEKQADEIYEQTRLEI
jgi:hypothetical protein